MISKQAHTVEEANNSYRIVEDIITSLDEVAMKELLSGNSKDIDDILGIMLEEVNNVMNLGGKEINIANMQYLDGLSSSLDDYMKKESLLYFITSVLPQFDVQWFHMEWANQVSLFRMLCELAARGHGKSFFFSWAVPLWKLYRYEKPSAIKHNIRKEIELCKEGMIITNKYDLSKKFLRKIKEEIESNDILARKLLPTNNKGWAEESIRCKNGAEIAISSYNTSNRGPHPGWIVVDDFLDKSCLYSKEQRDKFWEVFSAEIMNMLLPQGQILVTGTPFHEKDLYASLKEDKRFKVFEYPAITPDGRILYESRFSYEDLIAIKEASGTLMFSREILVKPVTDSSTIFPWNILQNAFIGMDTTCMVDNVNSYPVKFKKVTVGCDFAKSANIGADYTVFTVWGLDSLENCHLLHMWRKQGASHNEQIAELQKINYNFNPDRIIMETNAFQAVMLELAIQAGLNRAEGFVTDGFNKKDPYEGIPALAVMFERGIIKLPRGDEYSKQTTDLICSEFNSVTFNEKGKLQSASEHDDTVMSAFFGLRAITKVSDNVNISFI